MDMGIRVEMNARTSLKGKTRIYSCVWLAEGMEQADAVHWIAQTPRTFQTGKG